MASDGKHSAENKAEENAEEPRVVVNDRRKIDPETGELRTPPTEPTEEVDELDAEAAELVESETAKQLAERTADLQRLQAEYANYRRRVERDREVAATSAKAGLLGELLTVLDDIERAGQHGDLTGPFKAVAEKFTAVLHRAGLEPFGATDEPFDPNVHEAVQHDTSPEVSGPTVSAVLRSGYKIGDRVLRSAMVAVTDYEAPAETASTEEQVVDGEVIDNTSAE